MPSNEITVEEWDKLPSPVEINKALCVLCSKNLEAAPEIKKGVHFECAVTELHTEYNLPSCERCGNALTIHDPNPITDGCPPLCDKCASSGEVQRLKDELARRVADQEKEKS